MSKNLFLKLSRGSVLALAAGVAFFSIAPARGGIYQWEWIDPFDHEKGLRRSDTLCTDGDGVNAEQYADLHGLDLSMAYLTGENLSYANCRFTNFSYGYFSASPTATNFQGADLTQANFSHAWLSGVNFANATLA